MSENNSNAERVEPVEQPRPARRRRRWPRVLLGLALLLLVIVGLAPYLLSTGPATRAIVAAINERIQGRVALTDLSLGWSGPVELRGVVITDPNGREVIRAERASMPRGVLALLRSPTHFGQVELDTPRADLYIEPGQPLSLVRAFQPRTPSASEGPLPDVRGRVVVRSGTIRVIPSDAPAYEVRQIDGAVDLDSLAHITAAVEALPPGDGKLITDIDVTGLVKDDQFTLTTARGTFKVRTTGPVDAGAIAALLAPESQTAGLCTLDATGDFQDGRIEAKLAAEVRELRTHGPRATPIQPINLRLAGRVGGTQSDVSGDLTLEGEPGRVAAKFSVQPQTGRFDVPLDEILGAILTGTPMNLPQMQLTSEGQVDLQRLAQAVPGLLQLREDVEIQQGRLSIRDLAFTGGATPALAGTIELTEIHGRHADRDFALEPLLIALDVQSREGQPAIVRQAKLESSFATGTAEGDAANLQMQLRADLERLYAELSPIFDFGDVRTSGRITLDGRVARASEGQVDLSFKTFGEELRYADATRDVTLRQVRLEQTGLLTLDGSRVTEITTERGRIDLDERLIATTSGMYRFRDGAFEARAQIERGDAQYVLARLGELTGRSTGEYGGQFSGEASAQRANAESPIATEGTIRLAELSCRGEPLTREALAVVWREALLQPDGSATVKAAALSSDFARLAASDISVPAGKAAVFSAALDGSADLARTLRIIAPFTDWKEPPPYAGQFQINAKAVPDSTAGGTTLAGQAVIAKLAYAGETLSETDLALDWQDVRVRSDGRTEIGSATLKSDFSLATLRRVRLSADRPATMEGEIRADADLARLLAVVMPFTDWKERPAYAGKLALEMTGQPSDAGARMNGALVLTGLTYRGEPLSRDEVRLAWKDGRLREGGAELAEASLQAEGVNARVRGLTYAGGDQPQVSGELDTTADLARVLRAVLPLTTWEQPPDLAGQLTLRGKLASQAGRISLDGNGQIEQFVAGRSESAVREPRVEFVSRAAVDTQKQRVDIEQLKLTSRLLGLEARGAVEDYTGSRRLDIECRYSAEWQPVMAMLHELAPATAGSITINGRTTDTFTVRGPLNTPDAEPAWRGVQTQVGVQWDSARFYGLNVSGIQLRPHLHDALLEIPDASAAASGGRINVGGAIDLAPADPVLLMKGERRVLDGIPINAELSRDVLSHLNPIFAETSEIQGNVSVVLRDVRLPLGADKSSSRGSGVFTASQIRLQPRGILAELVKLGSVAQSRVGSGLAEVRMSDLHFRMDNGRISYDDFTMLFVDGQLDLKFRGSIEMGGGMDLIVSVPVRAGLLEQFGVKGEITQYVRLAEGMRVDIPVRGTREAPQLDLASVDMKPILDNLLKQTISGGARDAVGRILGAPADRSGAAPPPQASPRPEDAVRDIVDGILAPRQKQNQQGRSRSR